MYSRQNKVLTEDILREYIRRSIIIEQKEILEERRIRKLLDKIKSTPKALKKFFVNLKIELEETKEGAKLLKKIASGKKLTKRESKFLKDQAKDIARGALLLSLFIAPGGAVLTALISRIANKYGVELKPSAFREQPAE